MRKVGYCVVLIACQSSNHSLITVYIINETQNHTQKKKNTQIVQAHGRLNTLKREQEVGESNIV